MYIKKTLRINAATFFGQSLQEVYKFYNISKVESFELSSIFFKRIYKIRKEKELLDSDEIIISYKAFKKIILIHCLIMSEYLDKKVRHKQTLSIFLKRFAHRSLKNEDLIVINKFTFFYSKNTTKMLSQCSPIIVKTNIINRCAIKILKMLVYRTNKVEIPLELALILLFDAQMINHINKKFFKEGSIVYKAHLIRSAIFMILSRVPWRYYL